MMNSQHEHRKKSKKNRQKYRTNASNLKNSNQFEVQAKMQELLSRSNSLKIYHDEKNNQYE